MNWQFYHSSFTKQQFDDDHTIECTKSQPSDDSTTYHHSTIRRTNIWLFEHLTIRQFNDSINRVDTIWFDDSRIPPSDYSTIQLKPRSDESIPPVLYSKTLLIYDTSIRLYRNRFDDSTVAPFKYTNSKSTIRPFHNSNIWRFKRVDKITIRPLDNSTIQPPPSLYPASIQPPSQCI